MDFRRTLQHQRTYTPLGINGTVVEGVSSYRHLGVHITEDLTWTTHSGEEGEARKHYYLVWPQLLSGQEGFAKGSAFG